MSMGCCSSGVRWSSKERHSGVHSLPLDLPNAVGHVLAHHLPAGLLYNVAAGRAACAQRKTSSKGKETHSFRNTFNSAFICSGMHPMFPPFRSAFFLAMHPSYMCFPHESCDGNQSINHAVCSCGLNRTEQPDAFDLPVWPLSSVYFFFPQPHRAIMKQW